MYFRDIRTALLLCHVNDIIDDEEFCLLYDVYRSKKPDIHHWDGVEFDLDHYTNEESKEMFRFYKSDIYDFFHG